MFFLNPIFCIIKPNPPSLPTPFKLQIQNAFVFGPNSQNSRLLRKKTVEDTLFLKTPTFCNSEISYPFCFKTRLFLKSLKILMTRYENNEFYIPSKGMVHVLKVIIDFAFKTNNNPLNETNNPLKIKFYLASLLGNVFHGTDFLSNLGPKESYNFDGLFYNSGRGVIQIFGIESYQLVSNLSLNKKNYVKNPGALAFYTTEATEDSLRVYNKLCKDFLKKKNISKGMTFYNTMEALKLDSLIAKKTTGKYPDDILKRIEIYKRICLVFGIPPFVGVPL